MCEKWLSIKSRWITSEISKICIYSALIPVYVNGTKIYKAKQTLLYLYDSNYGYHHTHTLRIQIGKYFTLFLTNNELKNIKIQQWILYYNKKLLFESYNSLKNKIWLLTTEYYATVQRFNCKYEK